MTVENYNAEIQKLSAIRKIWLDTILTTSDTLQKLDQQNAVKHGEIYAALNKQIKDFYDTAMRNLQVDQD